MIIYGSLKDQKYWKYYNEDSETDSWYELYKERYLLELNWKNGIFTQHKLSGHSTQTNCVKFYKNWIITGSQDRTIRIWDSETFKCLKVLGDPNRAISTKYLSNAEMLELRRYSDIKFHSDGVNCMDISDKYLVSGSWGVSCIIWRLPDFEPINHLLMSVEIDDDTVLNNVIVYNDYIVCSGYYYIGVWKSTLDNSEPLQFNLQFRLDVSGIGDICIHNDIIYSTEYTTVRSRKIESGQIIQEFNFRQLGPIAVKDQYLIAGNYDTLTVLDLQSNTVMKVLPYDEAHEQLISIFIIDNKIIYVNYDCTIKIWNLNDLKLFNKFVNLEHLLNTRSGRSICADSKRLAPFTINGDFVIYDFTENLRKKYLKHL